MASIHTGHRSRTKQKFLKTGLECHSLHEILEVLLFYSIPQGDTNELAHNLINRFGSFAGVFNATYDELLTVNGVGENTAFLIKFVPQLLSVYSSETVKGLPIKNSEDMCKFFITQFFGSTVEQLRLLCLDDELCIIKNVLVSEGDGCSVRLNTRRILDEVIKCGCSLCALAHNHPYSSCEPSTEDMSANEHLKTTLKGINVRLVDNVVVGRDGARSIISGYSERNKIR